MLRVTVLQELESTVYRLEGDLAGDWVAEFRTLWFNRAASNGRVREFVDLNGVQRIDADGMHLLSVMHLAGVRFVASAPYTRALLEELNGSVYEELPDDQELRSTGSAS